MILSKNIKGSLIRSSQVFPNKLSKSIKISTALCKVDSNHVEIEFFAENISSKPQRINAIQCFELVLTNCGVAKVLENSWTQSGKSKYVDLSHVSTKNMFILIRDSNPFSYKREYGYLPNSIVSEWYTSLLFLQEALFVGALSVDKYYSQVFIKKTKQDIKIRSTVQMDGVALAPGSRTKIGKWIVVVGKEIDNFILFAKKVKENNSLILRKDKIKGLCCAYYQQGNFVDEKYVNRQIRKIDSIFGEKHGFNLILIDGIPTPWGDWENSWNKLFPSGLKILVDKIHKCGCKAGYWITPFVASPDSQLFTCHPDWFIKQANGSCFEGRLTSVFDGITPSAAFRVLDITNTKYRLHLSKLIKKMADYGFEYIKIDFTYPYGFLPGDKLGEYTRVDLIREGYRLIKRSAGKSTIIQSAISQMSPLVGLVDCCRVGVDTLYPYVCNVPVVNGLINNVMLKNNYNNCRSRKFFDGLIWRNDPDVSIFRSNTGLSSDLVEKHRKFTVINDLPRWVGDDISLLSKSQIQKLIQFLK